MFHSHHHSHDHDHDHDHGHDHGDHDDHGHHDHAESGSGFLGIAARLFASLLILAGAAAAACAVMVDQGNAVVITRFGEPIRVLTEPGLAWKLPAPIEAAVPVDLRLRTTSTGQQDVGTKDGLRVLVQAYAAWQVPRDPEQVRRFLRTVRNDPDEAARQVRSLMAAALQVSASSFDLADLVSAGPGGTALPAFESRLDTQVAAKVADTYGIEIREVGIERLGLPAEALDATVARMRAERGVVAAEVTAEGLRRAAAIRAEADRDARVTLADAKTEAARIEAKSQEDAAAVQAKAYQADPDLYRLLRGMDTLGLVVGPNTRIVLRTDAAPFRLLTGNAP